MDKALTLLGLYFFLIFSENNYLKSLHYANNMLSLKCKTKTFFYNMTNKQLAEKLLRVASANPQGFTISLTDFQPIRKGWAVALKETQNCFGKSGMEKVIGVALEKTSGIVGGWKYGKDYYFDAVLIIEDENEATRLGIENEQIGIYQIHSNTYKELI